MLWHVQNLKVNITENETRAFLESFASVRVVEVAFGVSAAVVDRGSVSGLIPSSVAAPALLPSKRVRRSHF